MLELLVCPLTRDTLSYDAARQELISRAAKLAYPIRDGVPIMLPEEARKLDERLTGPPIVRALITPSRVPGGLAGDAPDRRLRRR